MLDASSSKSIAAAAAPSVLHEVWAANQDSWSGWRQCTLELHSMCNVQHGKRSHRPTSSADLMEDIAGLFLRAKGFCPACARDVPVWWKPYLCMVCSGLSIEEAEAYAAEEDAEAWGFI